MENIESVKTENAQAPVVENKKSFKKKYLFIGLLIVIVLAVVFVFFQTRKNLQSEVVVAGVGENKITLSDLKKSYFATTNSGTPSKPLVYDKNLIPVVLNKLIDYTIIEKELKDRNVVVSRDEVIPYVEKNFPLYKNATADEKKAFEDLAKKRLEEEKLANLIVGWKEGYFLLCRFDRAFAEDVDPKNIQTIYNRQKIYAKEYCDQIKQKLENNTTTFEKELENLKKNPIIGDSAWLPNYMTMGRRFTKDDFEPGQFIVATDLFNQVAMLNKINNVEELIAKVNDGGINDNKEAFYALVSLTTSKNGTTADLNDWLNKKRQELNIKTYTDKVNL